MRLDKLLALRIAATSRLPFAESVQTNRDAGRLPTPHANGNRYLSIPRSAFTPTDEVGAVT